ncbi:MAG: peptidoglycan DD-metalloendopeptidase family protein [Pseudomonadota bacterium]|nr:peptidoglycan DD-metalloendopeptidase family protein [Pseudomonadota bacterium]
MYWSRAHLRLRHFLRRSRRQRARCLAIALLPFVGVAHAALPPSNPVPGGIAQVVLGQPELKALVARFGTRRVIVSREFNQWTALVGLPISIEPGHYILTLEAEEMESLEPVVFSVKPARTPVLQAPQQWPQPQQATLSKSARRKARETVRAAISNWSDGQLPDFSFIAPASGEQLYPYSLLVTRGSGETLRHDYLTFLASARSEVVTPHNGTVLAVATLPVQGPTVFIDHGHGLISRLGGLEEVFVSEGEALIQGAAIGGAATADERLIGEVNWALYLNGQKIDPEPFIAR